MRDGCDIVPLARIGDILSKQMLNSFGVANVKYCYSEVAEYFAWPEQPFPQKPVAWQPAADHAPPTL